MQKLSNAQAVLPNREGAWELQSRSSLAWVSELDPLLLATISLACCVVGHKIRTIQYFRKSSKCHLCKSGIGSWHEFFQNGKRWYWKIQSKNGVKFWRLQYLYTDKKWKIFAILLALTSNFGVSTWHIPINLFGCSGFQNLPILSSQVTLWRDGCLFQNGCLVLSFDPISLFSLKSRSNYSFFSSRTHFKRIFPSVVNLVLSLFLKN